MSVGQEDIPAMWFSGVAIMLEVRLAQGPVEIDRLIKTLDVCEPLGADEVCAVEVGPREIGARKIGAGKIGSRQVCVRTNLAPVRSAPVNFANQSTARSILASCRRAPEKSQYLRTFLESVTRVP